MKWAKRLVQMLLLPEVCREKNFDTDADADAEKEFSFLVKRPNKGDHNHFDLDDLRDLLERYRFTMEVLALSFINGWNKAVLNSTMIIKTPKFSKNKKHRTNLSRTNTTTCTCASASTTVSACSDPIEDCEIISRVSSSSSSISEFVAIEGHDLKDAVISFDSSEDKDEDLDEIKDEIKDEDEDNEWEIASPSLEESKNSSIVADVASRSTSNDEMMIIVDKSCEGDVISVSSSSSDEEEDDSSTSSFENISETDGDNDDDSWNLM